MYRLTSLLKHSAAAALAVGLAIGAVGVPAAHAADKRVTIKVQSWFPTKVPHVGTEIKDLAAEVKKVTGGTVTMQVYEPKALIPPSECFDSVSKGAVDACWGISGYYYGKNPALTIFSALPFGPQWPELLAYFYYGGGKQQYDEIYARNNIKGLICGGTVTEASGWFRKEIKSVKDFKGLKMRIFGLGGKVIEKLGGSAQLLAAGDIFPALELGTIDATEFAMPAVDLKLGFYQVAKHYYFPGWHQPATLYEVIMNMDKWKSLSATQQAQMEAACGDNVRNSIAFGESNQYQAMEILKSKGVIFHHWSPEILAAFKKAWGEVVEEERAKNTDFKKAYDTYAAFRKKYAVWADYAVGKGHY